MPGVKNTNIKIIYDKDVINMVQIMQKHKLSD